MGELGIRKFRNIIREIEMGNVTPRRKRLLENVMLRMIYTITAPKPVLLCEKLGLPCQPVDALNPYKVITEIIGINEPRPRNAWLVFEADYLATLYQCLKTPGCRKVVLIKDSYAYEPSQYILVTSDEVAELVTRADKINYDCIDEAYKHTADIHIARLEWENCLTRV